MDDMQARLHVGSRVEGNFGGEGSWYPGTVQRLHSQNGTVDIVYDDGDSEQAVKLSHVRIPAGGSGKDKNPISAVSDGVAAQRAATEPATDDDYGDDGFDDDERKDGNRDEPAAAISASVDALGTRGDDSGGAAAKETSVPAVPLPPRFLKRTGGGGGRGKDGRLSFLPSTPRPMPRLPRGSALAAGRTSLLKLCQRDTSGGELRAALRDMVEGTSGGRVTEGASSLLFVA